MADLVQFVHSIDLSANVWLDLNGEATNGWYCRLFDAPPPRLRRSVASNAMRDGIQVGASTYEPRVITLELELIKATQDSGATELQKLARELDKKLNVLKYQPAGATKPVYFRTFRSDMAQIQDVIAQQAMRRFTVELLAEPFAYGGKESLGPFTVNNDPAAATNACYFEISDVLGDVPAPPVLVNESAERRFGVLATGIAGFSADVYQAEQMGLLNDTSNPGGGPDAAMSGTGTNNFVRTSFATTPTVLKERLEFSLGGNSLRGVHTAWAIVRRSDATSVFNVGAAAWDNIVGETGITPSTVQIPLTTDRVIVRLGQVSFEPGPEYVGGAASNRTGFLKKVKIFASRASGAGTLDWDAIALVPANVSTLVWDTGQVSDANYRMVIDAGTESIFRVLSGEVANVMSGVNAYGWPALNSSGGMPALMPGVTNRLVLLTGAKDTTGTAYAPTKSIADSWRVRYWPRYLYVRPSAS